MSSVVLDASSVLALLQQEAGAADVRAAIHAGASISAVNVSEVVAKLADGGLDERAIRETIGSLVVVIVPFDEDLAFRAGLLRPVTRSLGLSFGDRVCIALGQQLGPPAMTADRAWSRLNVGITIRLVR